MKRTLTPVLAVLLLLPARAAEGQWMQARLPAAAAIGEQAGVSTAR